MSKIEEKILIPNIKIFAENHTIEKGYIKIEQGIISDVNDMSQLKDTDNYQILAFAEDHILIPGMIDLHIHGVNGADVMDASIDALHTMTNTLPREGTTSFLATTMTESVENINRALLKVNEYMEHHQQLGQAEIIGVHLEGPFINKEMPGAQAKEHIVMSSVEQFKKWQKKSNQSIKLVTFAPELDEDFQFISHLAENHIIASVGHSKATYDQVCSSITKGLSHVTHLFNQMSGFHHREPGVVGAAFHRKELMVELIADGIHVRPEVVDMVFKQITEERLIMITDSMRAKCLKNGQYELGGQLVTVMDGKAILNQDTLAGSVLKMKDAFKNIQQFTKCNIQQAIRVTAENPAKQMKLFHRKGSIAANKDADLVVLDKNMEVSMTICRGKIAYQKTNAD
ncbi:N-acetylglucosamine-6-phosphate deacetylase [Bacillus timonensis]|nr:N-acetylglucosamine-6-phosphate deacetylase [Bacillus timonensis]